MRRLLSGTQQILLSFEAHGAVPPLLAWQPFALNTC